MINQKTSVKYIETICTLPPGGPLPEGCYRQIYHMNVCGVLPIEIAIATPMKENDIQQILEETELFYINGKRW